MEALVSPSGFFDRDAGTLARPAFTSQELFDHERKAVFLRAWMFVGHESQVPCANDFFVSRMGTDCVILTRDSDGDVHVFLNSCRHKGMRVVRYDEGNAKVFTCPYHAWSYAVNGNLVDRPGGLLNVHKQKQSYEDTFDKSAWGLVNARVRNYKGAIFATWADDAPDFDEYLGDFHYYLDALLDHRDGRPGGSKVVAGVMKWRVQSNWKAAAENFIGDALHGPSHSSVEAVGIGPGGPGVTRHGQRDMTMSGQRRAIGFPAYGHGGLGPEPWVLGPDEADSFPQFLVKSGPLDRPDVVDPYFRELAERRAKNLKGKLQAAAGVVVGGVFPNMSFHTHFPRTIAVWHPISPTVTEGWRWLVVDEDAPVEVVDVARHHFMRYSGPGGMTEQDDMENWKYLTEASLGEEASRFPYNYQAQLHLESESEVLEGGVVSGGTFSEGSIRSFYTAWQRHIECGSWHEYLERVSSGR